MKYNKIQIYLRQFSGLRDNPDRPAWFNTEKVFINLLKTIDANCSLTVCFEREKDFNSHFTSKYHNKQFNFNLVFIDTKTTNRETFSEEAWSHSVAATSEIILKDIETGVINDQTLIYILEEDYLHLPYWPQIVLDLFNNFIADNDYVCLYDHNDKYIFRQPDEIINKYNLEKHWGMYRNLKSEIIASNARHWRNLPNCGLSMVMSKALFLRDQELWIKGYSDCEIGHQLSTKHKTNFWTPMPSISTHCINPFVAPLVDWQKVISQ